jgi:uncharacterized protein YndB with AHSA1/START domain
MKLRTIEVHATSDAPVAAVWELVADIETWSRWGAWDEAKLERPGTGSDPRGVGAYRRFRTGRVRNLEEVVGFDPPHALAYEVRKSDVPVRDYHADVILSERPGGGTTITWRSTYRSRWPGVGGYVQRRLTAFIDDSAQRLAAAAQERAQG